MRNDETPLFREEDACRRDAARKDACIYGNCGNAAINHVCLRYALNGKTSKDWQLVGCLPAIDCGNAFQIDRNMKKDDRIASCLCAAAPTAPPPHACPLPQHTGSWIRHHIRASLMWAGVVACAALIIYLIHNHRKHNLSTKLGASPLPEYQPLPPLPPLPQDPLASSNPVEDGTGAGTSPQGA